MLVNIPKYKKPTNSACLSVPVKSLEDVQCYLPITAPPAISFFLQN